MKFKILAFGIAKEIMNGTTIEIDANVTSTGELRQILEEKYPRLKSLKSYMLAVNEEYANDTLSISESDEIAVIPPVSGG